MTLQPAELAQLVRIIDRIYEGKSHPRVSGRFGQYLRMCSRGRFEVQQLLAREGLVTTKAGWVNGLDVGDVTLSPVADLQGSVPNDLWGPVEHLPALSEELGAVVDLTLWTSATAANRAHVLLSASRTAISLSGAYRWFTPSRVTPGEARVEAVEGASTWQDARFLKATADDAARSPHALEYVLDYRLGPPSLKAFRVLAVRALQGGLTILPGLDSPARVTRFSQSSKSALWKLRDGDLALIFAYVEPWSSEWVAIDVVTIDDARCLQHTVAWLDFQAEVRDKPALVAADLTRLRAGLMSAGLNPPPVQDVIAELLPRAMNPPARALIRWLRYRE